MRATSVAVLISSFLALGCASRPAPVRFVRMAAVDPATDLTVEEDRDMARAAFVAMPRDQPERVAARAALARASLAVMDAHLAAARYKAATLELFTLLGLWQADPDQLASEATWAVPALTLAAATLAAHGADHGALAAQLALAELDPAGRPGHLTEVADILAYLDDLGVAEVGPAGAGQLAIAALEPLARALPTPAVIDDLVRRLVARQQLFTAILATGQASVDLVKAHGDVFTTGRRIAAALALGGRTDEIGPTLRQLRGLGSASDLLRPLAAVATRPAAWLDVAVALAGISDTGEADDPDAALALLAHVPTGAIPAGDLALAQAQLARAAALPLRAIAAYDAALALAPGDARTVAAVTDLRADWIEWLVSRERMHAATDERARAQAHIDAAIAAGVRPGDVAGAQARLELAWGRALLGEGLLDEAQLALDASLATFRTGPADLAAGRLALGRGRPAVARAHFEAAIEQASELTVRGRVARLAGDAAQLAGDAAAAQRHWIDALSIWGTLGGRDDDRTRADEAERLLEVSRCLRALGEDDKAFEMIARATAVAPDEAERIADAVDLLLAADAPLDAAGAFEQLLGSPTTADDAKTALALWLVADARQRHAPATARVQAWLAARPSDAGGWVDRLAVAATGRVAWAALTPATPRQQMQLAYYRALLDDPVGSDAARRRLAEVIAAAYVLSHEYGDATARLARPR